MTKKDQRKQRIADYFRHAQEVYGSARAAAEAYGTNNHSWAKLTAGDVDLLRSDARRRICDARGWPPEAFNAIGEGRDPDQELASPHHVVELRRRLDGIELRLLRLEADADTDAEVGQ